MKQNRSEFREFAERTVKSAGKVLLSYKHNFKTKTVKDEKKIDIATTADYASEQSIIAEIKKHYPDHGILAEETGKTNAASDYCWIIDPLDGTKEYVRGIPYYYVLLALEYKGELICAAAYQPETNYLYSADKTHALRNSKQFYASKQTQITKSFISIGLPSTRMPGYLINQNTALINSLANSVYRLRHTQWDVESLIFVAIGAYDGFISLTSPKDTSHQKWWDIAPGILLVQSAGGTVTDLDGNRLTDHAVQNGIVASNGLIHESLLSYYKQSTQL